MNYKVLRAADYGVPQLRDRLFVVAVKGIPFIFPQPTHQPLKEGFQQSLFTMSHQPYKTVREVIGDLPSPVLKGQAEMIANHVDVTPRRDRERINGVPEGDFLARQLHLPTHQRQRLNPKKDTTKFRRLTWDEPSLTLRGGEAFYHPSEDRYLTLTPREFMRLHGFNDDHVLRGPIRGRSGTAKTLDQHRLVANSVPPSVAKAIGEALVKQVLANQNVERSLAIAV